MSTNCAHKYGIAEWERRRKTFPVPPKDSNRQAVPPSEGGGKVVIVKVGDAHFDFMNN